ncbi:hypothetical protein [Sediminibacterium goheungense]|uniref:Uncharacterized protein n=1 Tax=Sediminibacterium goheungense TaxID=1086393 RepID=A0A4R6IZT1_9BACT|nr:hypothetical protein [Sediminibacterium goheungense]TDO28429.1 hypothetical protein BC659_0495 [Sediminibacterium goheungense]
MRNTTKLKAILKHYHLDLSLNEKEEMIVNLFHKETGTAMTFEDPSYSKLISKAYSYMNKQLKEGSKKE